MARTIELLHTNTLEELRIALRESKDESQKTRLKVIISLRKGVTRINTGAKLLINTNTITEIVKRYNQKGLVGLRINKGGRKEGNPKWNTEIFNELVKEIHKQDKYWSIPLMMQWIKEKYKQDIPEQTVWYHIDKRGYSYKSARPHPYLGNKEKQDAFKKGA